jgi:hypothetical protein
MKRFLPNLLFTIFLFISFCAKADDVIIPYGKNNAIGPKWKYKGGGTNLDAIGWKAIGYGEPGWLTANKSAFGYGPGIPLNNTTIPADASAGGGGVVGARYPTLYFRNTVFIVNPNIYSNFQINAKFDDAIVVWVNGVEAYRNNITANPLYASLATASIAGNGGTVSTGTISSSLFVAGNNIIAVEIHQRSTANNADGNDFFFDMELRGLNASLTRGPYLQVGNETGVTIRWRTAAASDSKITWGTVFGTYPNLVSDATSTTEHILRVTGLTPDTKYYYTIGNSTQVISSTNTNYFVTAPASSSTRKFRYVAIGDCGNASANQIDAKNSYLNYMNGTNVDAMITLGDNAYSSGLDAEFQAEFFDIYKDDILKFNRIYMAPGNHDYGNTQANSGVRNNAYYDNFSAPTAAECGGVASGTEAYYSFDIGNVHFLSLDSYGKEDGNTTRIYDTLGAQVTWIKADLAANTKRWVVAYFHHPPYTKTSHTSDTEQELIDIRERFIRILERYGVDMVLCGHAHGYERSYLLKGFYNTPGSPLLDANFNAATHTATGNTQNAKYDGTANSCAYKYNSGKYNHGTVYVVSGSAGQLGGTSAGYPQDCMYYSNATNGGVFYFETDSNRLDAKFISYNAVGDPTPVLRDSFTIFKDVNKVKDTVLAQNTPLDIAASWRGTYIWPNNGSVTTQGVTLNNSVTGTFNYIVTDANSCLKDSFHVVVTPPLPVLVNSFTATLKKDIVSLDWSTSQEINNKFFSIERSTNGISYTFLGNVNAAGNSSVLNKYHLNDLQPEDGTNYYRLSQTDFDGRRTNIEVKRVTYKSAKDFSATIVNAGGGIINVAIHNAEAGMIQLKVVDMMGREVLKETFNSGNGNTTHNIQLNQGTYVLVLANSRGQSISTKIIAD